MQSSINFPGCYRCVENKSEGAPGPYIIHSDRRKRSEKELSQAEKNGPVPPRLPKTPDKFLTNLLYLEESTEEKKNPLGLKVRTTTNGSMTQSIFYDFCEHFVSSLPISQGKDKEMVILFLDGHVSRWNLAALRYLMINNVYPFFLASHTSIWSQPNDNGPIKRLHSCIEDAALNHRRWNKAIVPYFNLIFVQGWRKFIRKEADDLNVGTNNATSAFSITGLYPFNPLADTWEQAIETLGFGSDLNINKEIDKQWEVKVIRKDEGRPTLNYVEQKVLRTD